MQTYYDIEATRYPERPDVEQLMRVMVQIAASAVAGVQALDRREGRA